MKRKINPKRSKLVIFLGIFSLFPLFIENYSLTKVLKGRGVVVLDGDTFIIQGQSVRLYGIDAPEIDQRSFDKKPIGLWSKKHLEELLQDKLVRVEYEKRGYYGRIIGRVYTEIDINKAMLQVGMAVFSRYSKRQDFYLQSYHARLKKQGIYKTSGFLNPSAFRRKKKAEKSRP